MQMMQQPQQTPSAARMQQGPAGLSSGTLSLMTVSKE
jgi:hypothetical protein